MYKNMFLNYTIIFSWYSSNTKHEKSWSPGRPAFYIIIMQSFLKPVWKVLYFIQYTMYCTLQVPSTAHEDLILFVRSHPDPNPVRHEHSQMYSNRTVLVFSSSLSLYSLVFCFFAFFLGGGGG